MIIFVITGGISVACVERNTNRQCVIRHFQPYCEKDFINANHINGNAQYRTIGALLNGISRQCIFLYPNIRREDAFPVRNNRIHGYVPMRKWISIKNSFEWRHFLLKNL